MAAIIERELVRTLMKRGGQLVEVLPEREFRAEHIAGAVNIPLAELARRAEELRRDAPVIVYCEDYECDLSPRAAVRLEHLGFTDVYDYAASKLDWKAAGWPTEGDDADGATIGRAARPDVPTCGADDRVADVAERMRAAHSDTVVVVAEGNVVIGEIDEKTAAARPDERCGDVMQEGPSTYRPFVSVDELDPKLKDRTHAIVTNSSGELIGIYERRGAVTQSAGHGRRYRG